MSMKKATPKAVFEACEQLELLGRAWNRDDVRSVVGGGGFAVIDPLIQAWRKLKPVREVAPSVSSDLLIQVATLLEQQISGYVKQVEQRDQEREEALLEMNAVVSENLQQMESELTTKLEQSQQANHELEAELARLESDLDDKNQALQVTSLKLEVSDEASKSLHERLEEQKTFYESALLEQKTRTQNERIRADELHQQQLRDQKVEYQQQIAQQKAEITDAAEIAENRLMRLLDQGRNELKELNAELNLKIDTLNRELHIEKQRCNSQNLEIKALISSHEAANIESNKAEQSAKQQVIDVRQELAVLHSESKVIKNKLLEYQAQGNQQEKSDLQQLKDSIRLLQEQVQGK